MKIEELLKDLDPVTIIEFKNYIINHLSELCSTKNSNSKIISKFKNEDMICKECGSKLYKNGRTQNGIQKYICSCCKKTYSETTCTTNMLNDSLGQKLNNAKSINADSASAYQEFCQNNQLILNAIPSGFHSDGIYNISEINGIHSQLETWLKKFRGVSTRHLQEYLDWFVYIFTMKKRFMVNKIKTESYTNIIIDNNYIKAKDIFHIKMPIDLNIAYAEYINQS